MQISIGYQATPPLLGLQKEAWERLERAGITVDRGRELHLQVLVPSSIETQDVAEVRDRLRMMAGGVLKPLYAMIDSVTHFTTRKGHLVVPVTGEGVSTAIDRIIRGVGYEPLGYEGIGPHFALAKVHIEDTHRAAEVLSALQLKESFVRLMELALYGLYPGRYWETLEVFSLERRAAAA